jgi:hypothetical protein
LPIKLSLAVLVAVATMVIFGFLLGVGFAVLFFRQPLKRILNAGGNERFKLWVKLWCDERGDGRE